MKIRKHEASIFKLLNESKGEELTYSSCSPDYARKMVNNYNDSNDRYFTFTNNKGVIKIKEV